VDVTGKCGTSRAERVRSCLVGGAPGTCELELGAGTGRRAHDPCA
jgi:hypothetical protein